MKDFKLKVIIIFISLVINLFIAAKAGLVSDTANFYRVGQAVSQSINPYVFLKDAYPYPPLSMFISFFNYQLAQITGIGFPFVNRLLPIVSFFILGLILFPLNTSKKQKTVLYLLYFLNPLLILVNSVLGQFDIIILCLLVIVYKLFARRPFLAGLFFGLASLLKIYPLFVLPLIFINLYQRKKYLFKFLLPFLSVNILFWFPFLFLSFKDTLKAALFYSGYPDFGWGGILRLWLMLKGLPFSQANSLTRIYFLPSKLLFIFLYLIKLRKTIIPSNLYQTSLLIFLLFLVVYPGLSLQYLIWILPFLFYRGRTLIISLYSVLGFFAGCLFIVFSNPSLLGFSNILIDLRLLFTLELSLYLLLVFLLFKYAYAS